MEVNETQEVTEISVKPIGIVQVQLLRVFRDAQGNEVARNGYIRYTLEPGASLAGQPADVAAVATLWWTPQRIAAWSEHVTQNGLG